MDSSKWENFKWKMATEYLIIMLKLVLSHIQLFENPWTVAPQASLSMGFPKQEHWSGLPFSPPGNFPKPGIKSLFPLSPALLVDSLLLNHWGSTNFILIISYKHIAVNSSQFTLPTMLIYIANMILFFYVRWINLTQVKEFHYQIFSNLVNWHILSFM